MVEPCYICLEYINNIPLLRCKHFICSKCYCELKNRRINNCQICQKKLIRGCKINK